MAERRTYAGSLVRLRGAGGVTDGRTITGHAAVFDSASEDLGGFVEVVRRGAFARTLRDGADVRALFNHDPSLILGRNKSGTLRLREDTLGLRFDLDMPDTTYARDLAVAMRRGDVTQCSFGFVTKRDRWDQGKTPVLRELLDVDLLDVSVVVYPAYASTDAKVASSTLHARVAAGSGSLGPHNRVHELVIHDWSWRVANGFSGDETSKASQIYARRLEDTCSECRAIAHRCRVKGLADSLRKYAA